MKKLVVAIAALAMLASSAYAAEWDFYGNARIATFYTDVETINTPGTANAKNISEDLQSNSRIGANVKVSDELSGRFEYGTGVNVRLLYGEWNFGAGKFLVGQDYTLVRFPKSSQVYATDNGMGGWGELASSRTPQLKLTFGGLQIAIVQPDTDFYNLDAVGAPAPPPAQYAAALNSEHDAAQDVEVKLPGIQAKYIFNGDNWMLSAMAAYQTFEVDPNGAALDIKSYVLGIGGDVSFGAAKLAGQVHGGENVGNMSTVDVGGGDTGIGYAAVSATVPGVVDTVIDNEAFGYSFVLSYAVNDMFGLEIGYGKMQTEYDTANSTDDEVQTFYIQAPITMAPGVTVTPEIGMIDEEETGQDEITYFGAKWQISF